MVLDTEIYIIHYQTCNPSTSLYIMTILLIQQNTTKSFSVRVTATAATCFTPTLLLLGKVKIFPLCPELHDPLLLSLEALPHGVFVHPGLNVQHSTNDLLSKIGRKVIFVFDNMGKPVVHAKVNVEVGQPLWDRSPEAPLSAQPDQFLVVRPFLLAFLDSFL